jgi:Transglutaminase-like superfamily
MSWRNDLRKVRTRSREEGWRLLEAAFFLVLMRAAVLLFSFQSIARWLGLEQEDAAADIAPAQANAAAEVARAVDTVAMRMPWNTCLVQTLAAAAMMRRRSIPCTLCLGVAKGERQIVAHAWLRCGKAVLAGASGHQRFAVISAFSVSRAERGLADAR